MSFLAMIKKQSASKPKESPHRQKLGKSVGIVWEYGNACADSNACIVQIRKEPNAACMTIFESDNSVGISTTNFIEHIATGVYFEHLSEYKPEQVRVRHKQTLLGSIPARWGEMEVLLDWDKKLQMFQNPRWENWVDDFPRSPHDERFLEELRIQAAIGAENFMRSHNERSQATPREKELYERFQRAISHQGISVRYRLRYDDVV